MIRLTTISLSSLLILVACETSRGSGQAQPDGRVAKVPPGPEAGPQPSNQSADTSDQPSGSSKRFANPSLVQLIVAPDKFRGAAIRVKGFWVPFDTSDGAGSGALYLDAESAANRFQQNAVGVLFGRCRYVSTTVNMIDSEKLQEVGPGYVTIGGVFEPSLTEDPWLFAGQICNIWSMHRLVDSERERRIDRFGELSRRAGELEPPAPWTPLRSRPAPSSGR